MHGTVTKQEISTTRMLAAKREVREGNVYDGGGIFAVDRVY